MIAWKNYGENRPDYQEKFACRRRLFQPHPCHQIQPDRQETQIRKPSENEGFCAGIKQDDKHRGFHPRPAHHEKTLVK